MLLVEPLLPAEWGMLGAERLATTSQILAFKRKHLQSNLNQISVTQLFNAMKPGVIMANSMSLPDSSNSLTKDKEGW